MVWICCSMAQVRNESSRSRAGSCAYKLLPQDASDTTALAAGYHPSELIIFPYLVNRRSKT